MQVAADLHGVQSCSGLTGLETAKKAIRSMVQQKVRVSVGAVAEERRERKRERERERERARAREWTVYVYLCASKRL